MGEDEYDDIDSDLEDELKSPANEALERLLARERPTEDDIKLAEPFYKKLAEREKVPFLMVRCKSACKNDPLMGVIGVQY